MKRSTFASLSAAGALMLALAPGVSHAQWDGQVKFVGKISDVTCLINGNAQGIGNIREVPLGVHEPSSFTALHSVSTAEQFEISLTDAGGGACKVDRNASVAFDKEAPSVDKESGNLKITSTSPATGIQIQINDAGNGKNGKIVLGAAQENPQTVKLTATGGVLTYSAQYVRTGVVGSGSGNSIIPFMVAYD